MHVASVCQGWEYSVGMCEEMGQVVVRKCVGPSLPCWNITCLLVAVSMSELPMVIVSAKAHIVLFCSCIY